MTRCVSKKYPLRSQIRISQFLLCYVIFHCDKEPQYFVLEIARCKISSKFPLYGHPDAYFFELMFCGHDRLTYMYICIEQFARRFIMSEPSKTMCPNASRSRCLCYQLSSLRSTYINSGFHVALCHAMLHGIIT
jgi:hypothetical protein